MIKKFENLLLLYSNDPELALDMGESIHKKLPALLEEIYRICFAMGDDFTRYLNKELGLFIELGNSHAQVHISDDDLGELKFQFPFYLGND